MKYALTLMLSLILCIGLSATDPIKKKTMYIEFDISYPFHQFYKQALFQRSGHAFGSAVNIGDRRIPISLEYSYQSPMVFAYRNNSMREQFQEIGLRYNLNNISYIIPRGVDPYLGAGVAFRNSYFKQSSVDGSEILSEHSRKTTNYKLSGGVKLGNNMFTIGLHYDYLPSKFNIPNPESEDLIIYNSLHLFSARLGIRIFSSSRRKIKCPRFNKKQKRTLAF